MSCYGVFSKFRGICPAASEDGYKKNWKIDGGDKKYKSPSVAKHVKGTQEIHKSKKQTKYLSINVNLSSSTTNPWHERDDSLGYLRDL